MNIAIIGSGYVGLVTASCLAELGNQVTCVDNDSRKIAALKDGEVPIYEPGLEKLIKNNVKKRRLSFIGSIKEGVKNGQIIFIAVGTPSLSNGDADLTGIENVARNIAVNMNSYRLIVEKSTVPVETGEWVRKTISSFKEKKVSFDVASNPEFLREGSAIEDFMHPDRIIIGVETKRARDILINLYKPLKTTILVTNIKSAELIKHASNAFLASKISFINAISRVCDSVGADVEEVARGMGLDSRIGRPFLNAGLGYGGSCFPKDLDAFISISAKTGYDFNFLKEVKNINEEQRLFVLKKMKDALWILRDKTIAVLGLSFKPNTDDIRNSPAIGLIKELQFDGAIIKVYDPQAMVKARDALKGVKFCKDPYDACKGAECFLVATEWNEFKELDFLKLKKMLRRPLVIDCRNIYDPLEMKKKGFIYIGIGRGVVR